jgi:nicotinate-nucleotide pyrophosphorylase (carboxylating)
VSAVQPEHRAGERLDAPEGPEVDRLLTGALEEDRGQGDLTSEVAIPATLRGRGQLVARETGRLAGLGVFARVFELLDERVSVRPRLADGDEVFPGDVCADLEGPLVSLLVAERTALNLVQRLSGVATLTARYVRLAAGGARVLDTRKTTPLLRRLEKYAVRCGGGENHRFGLHDEVMVKDNHVDASGQDLAELLRTLRSRHGPDLRITAEARDEAEALAAIAGDADVVLIDNLSPDELRALCPRLREAAAGRARPLELEASGGITLDTVADFAASGVDRVSVGALTHSAPALDLSLVLERHP